MAEACEMTLHGIALSNANLTGTDNLQMQLVMILEILSDHARKFDDVNAKVQRQADVYNRKFQETESMVRIIQQAMSTVTEQMKGVTDDIENLDKASKRIEKRVDETAEQMDRGFTELRAAEVQLRFRLDNHEPRIQETEQLLDSHVKSTQEEFSAMKTDMASGFAETKGSIEEISIKQKATRVKLDALEKAFQAADIEGLTKTVDDLGGKVSKIVEDHEKKGKELDEKIASLETGAMHIRKEMSEIKPYCDEKFSTKGDVKVLSDKLDVFEKEYITRKEFLEVQDDFHSQMTDFIMTELNTQRMDIYQKMTTVQERLTAEIEEASKGEEVQMCVERLQAFTRDIEDIGQSVAQHNEALEQSAFQISSMGREMFGEIDTLKDNHGELNSRVEGVMSGMHATVKAAIEEITQSPAFQSLMQRASGDMGAWSAMDEEEDELDEDEEYEDEEQSPMGEEEDGRSGSGRSLGSRPHSSRSPSAGWLLPPGDEGDGGGGAAAAAAAAGGGGGSRPGSSRSRREGETQGEDEVVLLDSSAIGASGSRPSTGLSRQQSSGGENQSQTPASMEITRQASSRSSGQGHGSSTPAGTQTGKLSRASSKAQQVQTEHDGPQRQPSSSSVRMRRPSVAGEPLVEAVHEDQQWVEAPKKAMRKRRPSVEGGRRPSLEGGRRTSMDGRRQSAAGGELPGDVEIMLVRALSNLQKVLEEQISQMRNNIYKDFVPKEHHEHTLKGFARKFADLDWKLGRARPETGEMGYRNAMYNQKLFGMSSPFLLAESHPAEKKKKEQLAEAGIKGPPGSGSNPYQLPRSIDPNSSTVATKFFESPEMRTAIAEGRELRSRGSSAAQRLYKREQPSFSVEVPAGLDSLLNGSNSLEEMSSVSLPRPRSSTPTRVTMLPRIEHIYPSDATHPWQIGPPRALSPERYGHPGPPQD